MTVLEIGSLSFAQSTAIGSTNWLAAIDIRARAFASHGVFAPGFIFAWSNELWSTSYQLQKPEYKTIASSGSKSWYPLHGAGGSTTGSGGVQMSLCFSSGYGVVPSSGSTNETTTSPSPVHLKVFVPPAPDFTSPSNAGRPLLPPMPVD